MGLFDMFSGRKQRLALMQAEYQQMLMQQDLMKAEKERSDQANMQFEQEQAQQEKLLAEQRKANRAAALDQIAAQLGGGTGFRSLLAGRKGGGGFGPRSMLDAA